MAWYETFFDEYYLPNAGSNIPLERTIQEVDFIRKALDLPQKGRILDLCCGHGRHTVELATAGYSMVGQDLSKDSLDIARTSAAERNVQIEFIHADMRDIPFEEQFDAVINIFTAFGYFDDDAEDQKVLNAVARALTPGGKFLVDVINAVRILNNYEPQTWSDTSDGGFTMTQRAYNVLTGCNEDRIVHIAPDGSKREFRTGVRLYFYPELSKMLNCVGLAPIQVFGDYDASEYGWESGRMIILSGKEELK
ncbi:class I SAM-dependent methyltransferase [Candidatus Poribacteria bacterium]|nr:class I SAM-dependent methyltransferase [Candidatus Poribacteria bacterium]